MKLSAEFPDSFFDLPDIIEKNLHEWKEWLETDCPESLPLPSDLSHRLKPFEVILNFIS